MQSDRISDEELGELSIVRNPFLCPNDGTVLPYGKWRHKECTVCGYTESELGSRDRELVDDIRNDYIPIVIELIQLRKELNK